MINNFLSERYVYELGEAPKEYDLETISKRLCLDYDYIKQTLAYEDNEINSAVMKAAREKVLDEKLNFLKDNFSTSFLIDTTVKKILSDYYSMNGAKKALLDSLDSSLNIYKSSYYTFSSDTLNLIAVNSVSNYEKTNYTSNQVCELESLKRVADGDKSDDDINRYDNLLGSELTKKEISLSNEFGALALNYEHTRNLVDFVKEHSLPKIYNQYIFTNVVNEDIKGKCYVAQINLEK